MKKLVLAVAVFNVVVLGACLIGLAQELPQYTESPLAVGLKAIAAAIAFVGRGAGHRDRAVAHRPGGRRCGCRRPEELCERADLHSYSRNAGRLRVRRDLLAVISPLTPCSPLPPRGEGTGVRVRKFMELLRQIEEEGERKIRELLEQAERQAQELLAQTEREIARERERALNELRAQLEQERRAALSRAHAQARTEQTRAVTTAIEELFHNLANEMARLREDPQRYRQFLQRCLREAHEAIQGTLVVRADPQDSSIVQELLRDTPHKLGEPIRTVGGLMVTNDRGDVIVDNRLETRLANLKARSLAELGRALRD
jgi:V/A-type H+-transporting ATPase subunit E